MNIKRLLLISAVLVTGCNENRSSLTVQPEAIAAVTFKSHLYGDIASDPSVAKGQKIRVVPDPREPTQNHESIVVQLPEKTPYADDNELYFLRGFAVGQLSAHNFQYL